MSLKRLYYDRGDKLCHTCKFIDEYTLNINDKGETPQGYDGTAICCKYDESKAESSENRLWVSPCWKACHKYQKCTERQADYLDIFDVKTQTIIENPNKIKE